MEDEMEEGEPMIYHPAPPSSSPLDNGPFFPTDPLSEN